MMERRDLETLQLVVAGSCTSYTLSIGNKVLNQLPPDINPEEKSLSRRARSELARLRSGYSRRLNNYLARIDPEIQDICPLCNATPHNTAHLFSCCQNPTDLQVLDLWTRPCLAAEFLNLDDTDDE